METLSAECPRIHSGDSVPLTPLTAPNRHTD